MSTFSKLGSAARSAARAVLSSAAPAAKANAFGSYGELEHALAMAEKWGGDWTVALTQALVRVADQRGVTAGAVFVWDAKTLTHKVDAVALQKTCDALVAS